MLIGVIYWAINCPVCAGTEYYGLQWFKNRKAIINWLAEKGKSQFFIHEVWDDEAKKKVNFKVNYTRSFHTYVGAEVLENNEKIAFMKQDPYDNSKKWIIEELDEEIEFSEE